MNMIEKRMDVLDVPQGWVIAHCISADMALGAGVAKQIDGRFNMREQLRKTFCRNKDTLDVGVAYLATNVFNLVTKEKYWQKPTLDTLRMALKSMADTCVLCGIERLAMPRIGCGLDRLNWDDVKPMIQEVFEDTNVSIVVCNL